MSRVYVLAPGLGVVVNITARYMRFTGLTIGNWFIGVVRLED